MATKKEPKQPKEPPAPSSRNVLTMTGNSERREQLYADMAAEGLVATATTLRSYTVGVTGDIGITEAVKALRKTIDEVNGGNLRMAESLLVGQACALNAVFTDLARRAALNMGTHLQATEVYLRLALKAQAQSRTTLEALAEIKNPRPVAFVKQANFSQGPQQINNGLVPPAGVARAEDSETPRSELLEASNGKRLDTRAKGTAGGADPHLEAVAAGHRATHA